MGRKQSAQRKRQYRCACGKSYFSNPALFTHIKIKHQGIAPGEVIKPVSIRGRGRPRKQENIGQKPQFASGKNLCSTSAGKISDLIQQPLGDKKFQVQGTAGDSESENQGSNINNTTKKYIQGKVQILSKQLVSLFEGITEEEYLPNPLQKPFQVQEVFKLDKYRINNCKKQSQKKYSSVSTIITEFFELLRSNKIPSKIYNQIQMLIYFVLKYMNEKNQLYFKQCLPVFAQYLQSYFTERFQPDIKKYNLENVYIFKQNRADKVLLYLCSWVRSCQIIETIQKAK